MNVELFAILASLAAGVAIPLMEQLIRRLPAPVTQALERRGIITTRAAVPYQARLEKSLASLDAASKEVDQVVLEISKLTRERETTIASLETHLKNLSEREGELKSKIAALEKVPIEAVRQFEEILRRGERRSALRDYILFGFGVIVSGIIAVFLKRFGY
jgi:hypothetical protein